MPAVPESARKSATGPIIANWPFITVPMVSTPTPANRAPPTTSKSRLMVRPAKAVCREKRSAEVRVLFSTACLAVSMDCP